MMNAALSLVELASQLSWFTFPCRVAVHWSRSRARSVGRLYVIFIVTASTEAPGMRANPRRFPPFIWAEMETPKVGSFTIAGGQAVVPQVSDEEPWLAVPIPLGQALPLASLVAGTPAGPMSWTM